MRDFWIKCACILLLQFVLIPAALSNTLTVDEAGNVLAETDRYRVRFEHGVLVHFHNKLTQETYTLPQQGDSNEQSGISIQSIEGKYGRNNFIDDSWKVESRRLAPLAVEVAYHSDSHRIDKTIRIRISIDADTGDLVIQQHGISQYVVGIMWGCGYLNSQQVNLILPADGGQIINNTTEFSNRGFRYPGRWWEAQLAILQSEHGGFFVHSTDTTYRFKEIRYKRSGEYFGISFRTDNFAPFREKKEIAWITWHLNAYRGDWQVPAETYRNWMENAFQPKQPPAWVKDIELVIYFTVMNMDTLSLLASHVNPSKTLLYLTNWRIGGWDENFPDYTPRPEFGDLLEAAHAYGFPVMLNTSFHGCSTYHPRYPEFEKHQFRHPILGDKLGWKLNDPTHPERRQFAYINPASNAFRKYFIAQLKTMYETYPIEAFHLDTNHLVENDANGLIDGLTAAEGNVLLHQELAEAMPGVVFGGEGLHEVTLPHVNFAQRRNIPHDEQPHPISSFLFSPSTVLYGYHPPNPDLAPERYQAFQETYQVWDILPTLKVWRTSILHPRMVRTLEFLESVGTEASWSLKTHPVGDVNADGVVNVLDLVMVAQHIGIEKPSNPRVDVNGDGVVNIQDLVIVANAFGN